MALFREQHVEGLGKGSVSYGDAEDFSINEVPLYLMQESGALDSLNGTTPVYVLKRNEKCDRNDAPGGAVLQPQLQIVATRSEVQGGTDPFAPRFCR